MSQEAGESLTNFDEELRALHQLITESEEGILLKNLGRINEIISQLLPSFAKAPQELKKVLILFFQMAKKQFIKEKSFDDKINFSEFTRLFRSIMQISDLLDLNKESLLEEAIELNYHSWDFLQHFMTSKSLMKVDQRVVYEQQKHRNQIEFLATKRTKNKRQCEEITLKE